ncbi:Lrp/AsnC ligand binding domain-containing protein [Streptomyces bicolor]|uniref:Lrp/AsnC ligand binding domain-containing protein n=1 Tax=Streptomyces bicolor TaxID=66874 RepID=UPI0004E129CE|nr:Lrp/AsnC ligand binding domain-containing protein [Streptomyces bicolor]
MDAIDQAIIRYVLHDARATYAPWHTEAFVEVYCTGNPTPAELRQALEAIPEVVEACTVSGAADAVVHMLARDIPHLEQAIQRVRATAPVERTESAIVLSRLLNRPRV